MSNFSDAQFCECFPKTKLLLRCTIEKSYAESLLKLSSNFQSKKQVGFKSGDHIGYQRGRISLLHHIGYQREETGGFSMPKYHIKYPKLISISIPFSMLSNFAFNHFTFNFTKEFFWGQFEASNGQRRT